MKLSEIDFRFVELYHELYALKEYMDSVEAQLPDLIKKEEEKAYWTLRENGYENDSIEAHDIQQRLYNLVDEVLPRYFWGPILVTLWAIFESAIIEIAKEIKDQQKQKIGLSDINGDFLERTNKYFNHILKIQINTRDSLWQHLKIFYIIRNALAHANGRLENIKSKKDKMKIKKWADQDKRINTINGVLQFTPKFIKEAYSIIFKIINELTSQVKNKYPKPINW
jgi:hypothetical protein